MKRATAPNYDLFKLVVTLVLMAILLLMLVRGCATISAAPIPTENPLVNDPAASGTLLPVQTETEAMLSSNTPESLVSAPTPTAIEPTAIPAADDVTPSPTPTVPDSATATPGSEQSASCNTSAPSRLTVGQTAQVVQRLNMRSQASIDAPILQTNPRNTQVELIGGPVCTPVGDRAYLWWQIRLASGAEGWSAESPLNEASYLLEPIP